VGRIKRDELAELFPSHDVWFVPQYCGNTVWCSRPKGHAIATINAASADDLQAEIAQELAEQAWGRGLGRVFSRPGSCLRAAATCCLYIGRLVNAAVLFPRPSAAISQLFKCFGL